LWSVFDDGMQVKETQNEGLKRGYQMTLPAADLAAMVDQKLKEAQPEVEMKGFRKGKVPMAMLKKQFGQRILGDAMQEAIDKARCATIWKRPATARPCSPRSKWSMARPGKRATTSSSPFPTKHCPRSRKSTCPS
jgi:hypothetical protein